MDGDGSRGLGRPPETPDALRAWLADTLGVRVPAAAREGYDAPMAYLAHAFFEGRSRWGGPDGHPADCVVWASRGGGKTFLGALATALDLAFKPGIEVRILGGSREQSSRMFAHLRGLFARPALAPMVAGRVARDRVELVNGSVCEILAQSHASVRGTRVQKLRCDEVELFRPDVLEAAQLTTRSLEVATDAGPLLVRGAVECLSTMHIPYGLMHGLVEQCAAGTRRLFRWSVIDVLDDCGTAHRCRDDAGEPACTLLESCGGRAKGLDERSRGHVRVEDALAMQARVNAAQWEAEMLCTRPTRSDAVLPEFDERAHVVDHLPEPAHRADGGWAWIAGMDFGLRTACVLWAGVDPEGGVWVIRERVASGELLEAHVRALREGPPSVEWVGVDPAGRARSEQTGLAPVQVLRRAGLAVRDRRVRLDEGLGLLRARLRPADGSAPRLRLAASCTELIRALSRYRYPSDPHATRPAKDGPDHAVDALRYMVQNLDVVRPARIGNYLAR